MHKHTCRLSGMSRRRQRKRPKCKSQDGRDANTKLKHSSVLHNHNRGNKRLISPFFHFLLFTFSETFLTHRIAQPFRRSPFGSRISLHNPDSPSALSPSSDITRPHQSLLVWPLRSPSRLSRHLSQPAALSLASGSLAEAPLGAKAVCTSYLRFRVGPAEPLGPEAAAVLTACTRASSTGCDDLTREVSSGPRPPSHCSHL